MKKVLTQAFFKRDAQIVARELLGKYLVRKYRGRETAYRITETEAYVGPEDKASHAYKGRTRRTEVMFGEAGYWYVYFVYGMYDMLNIVTGKEGHPAAVLIRAVQPNSLKSVGMFTGPGKLTKKLHITRMFNALPATKSTGLWIEDRGEKPPKSAIQTMPRIGVSYAEEWAKKPFRFVLKG